MRRAHQELLERRRRLLSETIDPSTSRLRSATPATRDREKSPGRGGLQDTGDEAELLDAGAITSKIEALERQSLPVSRRWIPMVATPPVDAVLLRRLEARVVALEEATNVEIVEDAGQQQQLGWVASRRQQCPDCTASKVQAKSLRALIDEERKAKERALAAEAAACETAWEMHQEQQAIIARLEAQVAELTYKLACAEPGVAEV